MYKKYKQNNCFLPVSAYVKIIMKKIEQLIKKYNKTF